MSQKRFIIYNKNNNLEFGMILANKKSNEQNKGSGRVEMKKSLKKYFAVFGITGILCSWTTLAFVWMGLMTASYVGYSLTAGLFGAAIVLGKN
jgi:hypothetical protein